VRELDQGLVDEVWQTLGDYDPARAQAEARGFIARQPHLVALMESLTEEFDLEVRKAALGLLFLLIKVYEAHREAPVASLSRARVAEAHAASVAWLARWDGADSRFLARSREFPQPNLIVYLIATYYLPDDSPEHAAEVKGTLFLLLQTVAEALTSRPEGEID
jgi:hypothetical protein